MRYEQQFEATLRAVSAFAQELETVLADVAPRDYQAITLAVQELCVNIVEHAYDGVVGMIQFELTADESELVMTFRDQAPNHYVPTEQVTSPDPLDLPEGGWGVFLIYQLVDEVDYQALDKSNRWRLVKYLGRNKR